MALAHINIETVRKLYNSNDSDVSAELETFAREHGAELDQDWKHEATHLRFEDGSVITMCGSQCDVSA